MAGSAASRDGAVIVTVDRAGALQHLELTEHAEVLTRAQLAAAVRRHDGGRQEAARQAAAALVPVFGERSAAMELFREHLDLRSG